MWSKVSYTTLGDAGDERTRAVELASAFQPYETPCREANTPPVSAK
jgi:hypothetical protein